MVIGVIAQQSVPIHRFRFFLLSVAATPLVRAGKEFSEQVHVAFDRHEDKSVVTIDGVHSSTKQGRPQSALGFFHGVVTEPKLVHLQPRFDFVSPDAVVALVRIKSDLTHRGIHLQHLHQELRTRCLSCF